MRSVENSAVGDMVRSPIIKRWLGWAWLGWNGWWSHSLTRRMSAGESQSSHPVWPVGPAPLEPPSGRQCQRDAGLWANQVRLCRHGGLPGSLRWGCVAWSPNNNALKWQRWHERTDQTAVLTFCSCYESCLRCSSMKLLWQCVCHVAALLNKQQGRRTERLWNSSFIRCPPVTFLLSCSLAVGGINLCLLIVECESACSGFNEHSLHAA